MADNRNFIIAALLSVIVLMGWQYFFIQPEVEEERARQAALEQDAAEIQGAPQAPAAAPSAPGAPGAPRPETPSAGPQPGAPLLPGATMPRPLALAQSPRVPIDTPSVEGSIALIGGRVDDLKLKDYQVTTDPESAEITLLSPRGAPRPFYAEFGWTATDQGTALPGPDTEWTLESGTTLGPGSPVTLRWDNGAGLTFRRTVAVDEDYLFTIAQTVENRTGQAIALYPYGLVSRHGTPATSGFFILHEGLIGDFDEEGLVEIDYDDMVEDRELRYPSTGGWLGITDKYWASVLVPDQSASFTGRFSESPDPTRDVYQTDYLAAPVTIPDGGTGTYETRLFAGAKVSDVIDGYAARFDILNFDLLIDWGWFYFLTKPLFLALKFFADIVGNFGVAILIVTVIIKLAFFPLANRSYVAMSKMKKLQPKMLELRDRYKDDKVKQQQELMELYKKEKVNPLAGCWPVLIQIPVFFALYKVLFVTIEMRHAPFFGWVQDLSAPDPTSIFNLFGLIPWDPPTFLMIGIWPLIMGATMFVQTKMNPAPADPMQQRIFTWMPLFFMFLLASFPAGLVIYWAWNNFLSILQQGFIMRRQGVKIELFDNLGLTTLARVPGLGKLAGFAPVKEPAREPAREEAKSDASSSAREKSDRKKD